MSGVIAAQAMGQKDGRIIIRLAARVGEVGIAAAQKHLLESEANSSIAAEIAMRKFWAEELSCFEVCGSGNADGGIISTLWCYCNNGEKTAFGCESPGPAVPQPGTVSLADMPASQSPFSKNRL